MVRCAIVITSVVTITYAAECVPGVFSFQSFDPIGVAIDADANVFVADFGGLYNGQILKCSEADSCQTFTKAVGAQGVAVTPNGTVYYSDFTGVKQCTPAGACVEFGSGWNPIGVTSGLELDGTGNVYVTSVNEKHPSKGRISRCTPEGSCKLFQAAQHWSWPLQTAVDSQGNVYVTGLIDATDSVYVKKCDSNGFCTEFTEFHGTWRGASAVAVDALDNVYIMAGQYQEGVLRKCTPVGECREVALHGPKEFQGGNGIKIGANGAVYVSASTEYDEIGSLIRYCIADSTEMV